jgi:type II secretory pathway predicted ATPase ExeA
MYEKDFGLRRRPFPATPDRAFYYPATCHEAALARLLRALGEDEGFALLTGAPGTGKTLLCHCLLDRLGADTASAFLTNSHFPDRASLLQAILYDFSLPYEDGGEQVLRLRLTDYLLKNCAEGRRALLLVDEAQHLSADLLEELRLLGNLEAGQGKAFQIILVGQPALLQTLARPELAACNQRLAARATVEPLGVEEGVDYLLHHIRVAGGKPESLLEEPALEILARGAGGVPRVMNQAGHQALSLAHQAEMNRVDAEAALEALAMLGLESAVEEAEEAPASADEANGTAAGKHMLNLLEGEEANPVRLFDSPRPA